MKKSVPKLRLSRETLRHVEAGNFMPDMPATSATLVPAWCAITNALLYCWML